MPESEILISDYLSPAGPMSVGSYGGRICLCDWTESRLYSRNLLNTARKLGAAIRHASSPAADEAIRQLREYFSGTRRSFDLELLPAGTDFRMRVWAELMKIPYGVTASYSEIARRIGSPGSVRAVASAIGANPISILIPCHRVIASDGSLAGYAGGIPAKQLLLSLERAVGEADSQIHNS